ncbi:hypothetical protein AADZ86_06495 [Colwelliaceae bacterium BS250]
MQPISHKSNKSLAIITLLMLAVIATILYLQLSTTDVTAVKVVNKQSNAPVTESTDDDDNKIITPTLPGKAVLIQPKSTQLEQQTSSWQPGISVAKDVKSVTTKPQVTAFYQYHQSAQSNIFSYQHQQTTEHNLDVLKFNPYLGVEAAYANLNSSQIGEEAMGHNVSATQYHKNDDAAAVFVNIIGTFDFDQSSALFAKIGINAWEINDEQLNALSTSANNTAYQANINSDSSVGTDIFYGIGFKYDWKSLIVKTEYQIIELNGEQYTVYSIGGTIRF